MYGQAHLPLAGATGVAALPFTGINIVWILLAAVALIAAAGALRRLAPMRQA
jgi:hypothetical protein